MDTRIEEIWAVPLSRAKAFLENQEDVRRTTAGFAVRCCTVTLQQLEPGMVGAVAFPRTRLTITGEDADAKAIRHRFLIQFLSAGG